MASYKLVFKRSVAKDFRGIPKNDVAKLLRRIKSLADDPHPVGAEKLTGQERYRIRQGDYRIIYEIKNELLVVVVVKLGHRREVYKTA